MEECVPQCKAMKMLVIGGVLIAVRLFTKWDIVIVIGAMLVVKALMLFVMPVCPCNSKKEKKEKK